MKKKAIGIFTVVALAALMLVPAVALGAAKISVPVSADTGGTVNKQTVLADKNTPIIVYKNTVTIGLTTVKATADPGYEFDEWTITPAEPMKVKEGTSIKASFKLSEGLSITQQPESVTVEKGKKAEFSIEVEGGSGKYSYQWKQNGYELLGAVFSTFTIPVATALNEGSYVCTVTDKVTKESISSDPVTLKLAATAHQIIIESVGKGAATASPSSAVKGTEVTLTATPADGYTFVKWETISLLTKIEDNKFVMPDHDITIYAHFARAEYAIDYELNGGQLVEGAIYVAPRKYTYGDITVLPTALNVKQDGKIFVGWYDNPNFEGKVCLAVKATDFGNKTYYAKWSSKAAIDIDTTQQRVVYNDEAQKFQVKTGIADPKIGYKVEYRPTLSSEWTEAAPTNAGVYDVRITRDEDVIYAAVDLEITRGLVIEQATITITPKTNVAGFDIAKKEYGTKDPILLFEYSGTIHKYEIPIFKGALSREAGEDAGSYAINLGTLTLANSLTFKAANYKLAIAEGYEFVIFPYQKPVVVKVTGHSGTLVYNGTSQAISGYEATTRDKVFNPVTDLTYSIAAEARGIDAGTYTMGLRAGNFNISKNFKLVTVEVIEDGSLTITQATQDAPEVAFINETVAGAGDGKITGTTTAMEYRKAAYANLKTVQAYEWVQATDGEVTGLEAGTYEIRYAEDKNHFASDATVGTIGVGAPVTVTFDMQGHGVAPETQYVQYNEYATRPAEDPTAEGYIFQGWFANVGGLYIEFPFETTALEEDITIYAEWCAYSVEVVGPVTVDKTPIDKAANDFVKGNLLMKELKFTLTAEQVASSDESEIALYAAIIGKDFVIYKTSLKMEVNGVETDISKTNETLIPVTYTFDFANKSNVKVWRLNKGEFDELTATPTEDGEFATQDSKANTITITASKYGVYAFSYTDSATPTPSPSPVTPQTGDTNNTLLIVVGVIAAVAVVALIFAVVMKRRSRH